MLNTEQLAAMAGRSTKMHHNVDMKMHHDVEQINVRYCYWVGLTNRCSLEKRLAKRWQAELLRAVSLHLPF